MSDDFPSDWSSRKLGDLVDASGPEALAQGWSPQCLSTPAGRDGWGVLKTTAIQDGLFLDEHNKALPDSLRPDPRLEVRPGDVLLTCAGPRVRCGVPALVRTTRSRLMISGKMYRLRLDRAILEPGFLEAWLRSGEAQAAIEAMKTGSSDSGMNLTQARFRSLNVPVPALGKQRRILAKLDALRARSRRAKDALDAVPALLDRLRQSILAAAFRGDLTADWREQNPDVEPASELLKRIRIERRKRWEEAEVAKLIAKGRPPKDDRWKDKYVEPEPVDEDGLPELPDTWCWASADALCTRVPNGGTPPASEMTADGGEIPFVKVYNLTTTGGLDFTINPTFVPTATHTGRLARSASSGPCVLLNIVGPPLGKVAVVPAAFGAFNFNQAIVAFHLLAGVDHELLAAWLRSPFSHAMYAAEQQATSGQFNISVSFCRRLPVPVPPVREQAVLSSRLRVALEAVGGLATATALSLASTASLQAAVLAAAFRGELLDRQSTAPASVPTE